MLIPAILFGPTDATRKAWRKTIAKAWLNPDAPDLFEFPAYLDAAQTDGPIVVRDMVRGWKTSDAIWHLNWINSTWALPRDEPFPVCYDQFKIVMNGLKHPWYCLGMLVDFFTDLYFLRYEWLIETPKANVRTRADYVRTICSPFLDSLLYWIQDLTPLADRFRYAYPGTDLTPLVGASWMEILFRVAGECGYLDYSSQVSTLQSLESMTTQQAIQALLNCGSIVELDGRLRVRA